MKRLWITSLLSIMLLSATTQRTTVATGYPITPVAFTSVKVAPGTFWGQRLEVSQKVTIPLAFQKCEETGRYTNFTNAATHLKDASKTFPIAEGTFSFDDTDPYKTIEGASYLLQTYPDEQLRAYVDSIVTIIGSAQEPDGYLYTARTQNPASPHPWAGLHRWEKEEELSHELYNLGHMVESAIAHYQATGSRQFLDIAIRYADCVCREVGPNPGQACVVPGHQIAEMALAKLYLITGDKKYLDEAKFFLDYRGKTSIKHAYSQAHQPVVIQTEAAGHAVRAAYMYAGMADVAALTHDADYIQAIDRIWNNIVEKKLYITGGIGATNNGEAFGKNYELPNMTAYCETCAAIGWVYVNYRLFLLHGEAKYFDVLERTLYNGLLSGYSLTGDGFFYPNPLASDGRHERQSWFGCACCPSNICRFIPSLPGYVYAVKDKNVYVNLYLSNQANLTVQGKHVEISQQTDYPWNGHIELTIGQNQVGRFSLKLRIPGWVRGQTVPSSLYHYLDGQQAVVRCTVNGRETDVETSEDGYLSIERRWKKGDWVELYLGMIPRLVEAHPLVEADKGLVCVECGPLVYCAEWSDQHFDLSDNWQLPETPAFQRGQETIANTPIQTWQTDVQIMNEEGEAIDNRLTLIPYYAWCHRGKGKMRVWMNHKKR